MNYLGQEYLLIVSTSSSETALPRLIAKMEHLGVSRPVVGIVVPTGYSFNLDGTAIYLTMASLFIANALGSPLSVGRADLAAGVHDRRLQGRRRRHRRRPGDPGGRPAGAPARLVDGVGLIVGIDRFMSEARALTNFSGNAVATLVIGQLGRRDRPRPGRAGARRRGPVRRGRHARRHRGRRSSRRALAAAVTRRPAGAGGRARDRSAQRANSPDRRGGGPSGGGPPPRPPVSDKPDDRPTESPQMP